jgi:hypothetical protein
MKIQRWFLEVVTLGAIAGLGLIVLFAAPRASWRWFAFGPATVTAAQEKPNQAAPAPPPASPAKDDKPAAPAKPALLPCVPDPRAGVLSCNFTHEQQQEVKIAQKDVTIGFQNYQLALGQLNGLLAKYMRENGWPENAQFDSNATRMVLPLPPPPAKESAKEPAKKP